MKRKGFILICIIAALLLTSCGYVRRMRSWDIKTSYQEYKDALKPTKRSGLFVRDYSENEEKNSISYTFVANGKNGGKQLADIVNTHNQFVRENPDYFKEGTLFTITEDAGMSGVEYTDFSFSSYYQELSEALGRENNGQLQFLSVDQVMYLGYDFAEAGFSAPVVVIWRKNSPVDYLKSIEGLEQVVIFDYNPDEDQTILENIQEIVPQAEIYARLYDVDQSVYYYAKVADPK